MAPSRTTLPWLVLKLVPEDMEREKGCVLSTAEQQGPMSSSPLNATSPPRLSSHPWTTHPAPSSLPVSFWAPRSLSILQQRI